MSKEHIGGAQEWHDEIGAALDRCDWFPVVLSPQSVASRWVKRCRQLLAIWRLEYKR